MDIGTKSGQEYDVVAGIKTFLGQMSEGGIDIAAAITKELLQNADDAQAKNVTIVLDERTPTSDFPDNFRALQCPSLLVGNDAPFKLPNEVSKNEKDDFSAIRSVASGHKTSQATSTGRFGIGFNSVYFITDTPIIFSRREVHLFDLLHKMFDVNGWKFSLDDFPASSSSDAGPVKNLIEWMFPKVVAGYEKSFGELAADPKGDYKKTFFRLPLRQHEASVGTNPLFNQHFSESCERKNFLHSMVEQAARAVLFLNHVEMVTFGILSEGSIDSIAKIEITPHPKKFKNFLDSVRTKSSSLEMAEGPDECEFKRVITVSATGGEGEASTRILSFQTYHSARFDDPELYALRNKLNLNKERAVPWASLAVPLDKDSFDFEGSNGESPYWRVFLPLIEEGPSGCVFSAALFVGPSRQKAEFVTAEGSDEALRKTNWNKKLVERALVPLLRNASLDMLELLQSFIKRFPKDYLSLFPVAQVPSQTPKNLSGYLHQSFCNEPWCLQLYDIWDNKIEIMVGDEESSIELEMIPEWLVNYRNCFENLSDDSRRFIPYSIGDAVNKRLSNQRNITITRDISSDVAESVLKYKSPPSPEDLVRLLKQMDFTGGEGVENPLVGLWCFVRSQDKQILRYNEDYLYISQNSEQISSIHQCLQYLKFQFNQTEWIDPQFGLPASKQIFLQELGNVAPADDSSALKLLSRLEDGSRHDRVAYLSDIAPVIDFLCSLDTTRPLGDLKLGFLVKTAHGKGTRRDIGVILINPLRPTDNENALWEGIFRRTYPEVDHDFSRELNRLLSIRPDCLKMLQSPDCKVIVANEENSLEIFDATRVSCLGNGKLQLLFEKIEDEMNVHALKKGISAIIATTIIEKAEKLWEHLSDFQKNTILFLPIHRLSNGKYTGMLSFIEPDDSESIFGFRLQSSDDLVDAPITLPEVKLLHHGDRTANRFYRIRLGLEEHGRAAVLKDTLRQIGSENLDNSKLLEYVAKYYEDTIELLKNSIEHGSNKDASELIDLFAKARLIHCSDNIWRTSDTCHQAWDVAEKLQNQGWSKNELNAVVTDLFYQKPIASINSRERKLIEKICVLPAIDGKDITKFAVSSDSPNLSLEQRIKIVSENLTNSSSNLEPSKTLRLFAITTLTESCEISKSVVIEELSSNFSREIAKHFVPNAVDIDAFSKKYNLSLSIANRVLSAFDVNRVTSCELREIIITSFADVWPEIPTVMRLQLLSFVGKNEDLIEALMDEVSEMDVACISIKNEVWAEPTAIIAPMWRKTNPPLLPGHRLITDECIDVSVQNVWNKWCGLNSAKEIINEVINAAIELPNDKKKPGAKALYNWFDKIVSEKIIATDDLTVFIDGHQWVLARNADEIEFSKSSEVLLLPKAQLVLREGFWVPEGDLPKSLLGKSSVLGFQETLAAAKGSIKTIGHCLASVRQASTDSLISVYSLLADLLSQNDDLSDVWREVAQDNAVFSLFRQPEIMVKNIQLFLSTKDFAYDIGSLLFCVQTAENLPKKIVSLYNKLGVERGPSTKQLLWALSNVTGELKKEKHIYEQIIDLLVSSKAELEPHMCCDLRILSCDGTIEQLLNCYLDDDLGRPENITKDGRKFLINVKDKATNKLIDWLEVNIPGKITRLRDIAEIDLQNEPVEVERNPIVTQILGPWEDIILEVTREGSVFRDELAGKGINVPSTPVKIVAVDNLSIRLHLPDGQVICQSDKWEGLPAYFDKNSKILVQNGQLELIKNEAFSGIAKFDNIIATEVLRWLSVDYQEQGTWDHDEQLIDLILNRLERPFNLLSQIRKDNRKHFFHQYHDQVADPEFAGLFEKYRKTREGSPQYQQLAVEMEQILLRENVKARRDDIRGYGYDEFSVFAELVQNAEDAYVQRDWLKMDEPEKFTISFKYEKPSEDEPLQLSVEHYGRPFNYWRHGALENENLKRDVEGVLRSKGSFKPHGAEVSDERTIGRFGLGFKSVFLITDRPVIHSENWHFSIEACCLPREISPPGDLPQGATRIVLPLRSETNEMMDPDGNRLLNLLPFLRKIDRLDIKGSNESYLKLEMNSMKLFAVTSTSLIVEEVHITGTSHTRGDTVRFLRFRNSDNDAQLAICLSEERLPVPWDEAFTSDFFVVLPLKVKLGCGAAISHLFEIQSGRTHLIGHPENKARIQEVAELVSVFPNALPMLLSEGKSLGEILVHFWSLWRWDTGDSEGEELRKALAKKLVSMAEIDGVVPTYKDVEAITIGTNAIFFFSQNIPDAFINALIATNVEFQDNAEEEIPLSPDNVVPYRFAKSFIETCKFAEVDEPDNFIRVTWEKIGGALSESVIFAELPELLNTLAECLPPSQYENVLEWLPECHVRGIDVAGNRQDNCPGELLKPDFPGIDMLPKRLLVCLDACYSEKAVELLQKAGLLDSPTVEQLQQWIENEVLYLSECSGILSYLAENGRYRTHYHILKVSMGKQWIPHAEAYLSISEAREKSILNKFLFEDDEFCAWLGLFEGNQGAETGDLDKPERPIFNPTEWLEKLFEWWVTNGDGFSQEYEQGIYPQGKAFVLQTNFNSNDRGARREWLSLFLLGSFHTMGYYKSGAHRNFLTICENKGWLQVFADPDFDAARWIDVLESYLDGQIGEAEYYQWVKQFVSIFQLSRWLDGYVDLFLDVEQYENDFSLNELLISRESVVQQRGGVDAPPLIKTLGIGANFVLRELVRNRVVNQPLAYRHCYVPIQRVRDIMKRMGCDGIEDRFDSKIHLSKVIHDFLVLHLGEDRATFNNSFDLPLLAVADGKAPQWDLPPLNVGNAYPEF